jgi:hypothetical protein
MNECESRLIPFHKLCKRVVIAGMASEHQQALVEPVGVVGHCGLRPMAKVDSLRD